MTTAGSLARRHRSAPWVSVWKAIDIDDYQWELYHVAEDFSQAVNLADKEPAKLRELQDLFWIEAAKYNVLPIDNSRVERMDVSLRPSPTARTFGLHLLCGPNPHSRRLSPGHQEQVL